MHVNEEVRFVLEKQLIETNSKRLINGMIPSVCKIVFAGMVVIEVSRKISIGVNFVLISTSASPLYFYEIISFDI